MRDQHIDVVRRHASPSQHLVAGIRHLHDGMLERFGTSHAEVIAAVVQHLERRRMHGAAAGTVEQLGQRSICLEITGQDPPVALLCRSHQRGSHTVAEENARRPVLIVGNLRESFRANDEHMPCLAGNHQALGHGECIEKPAACGADIEGSGVLSPQRRLQIAGLRRKQPIGTRGAHDDGIDVHDIHTGAFQHLLAGQFPHERKRFVGRGDAALANTRAFQNPFVRRVDHRLEVGIR